MVEQLGKYLEDEGIVTIGDTIIFNYQPDVERAMVALYDESVPQPDYVQGFNSDHVGAKFLTRGKDRSATKKLAWSIHKKIAQLGDIDLEAYGETVRFVSVDIVNPPTYLDTDNKNRVQFVSHYSVHIQTYDNTFRRTGRTLAPGDPEFLNTFDSTFDRTFA